MTRWAQTVILTFVLLATPACRSESANQPKPGQAQAPESAATDRPREPATTRAKRVYRAGDYESAAEIIYQELISDPENNELTLLASQIEAARGDSQRAVELLRDFDFTNARLGDAAAEHLVQQAMKIGDDRIAELTLKQMIRQQPSTPKWRHLHWQLLDRQGRRQEASEQADRLCQLGQATTDELLSLIQRSEVFPPPEDTANLEPDQIEAPLRRAKWYVARQQFAEAERELAPMLNSDPTPPSVFALNLRILAEQQKSDAFRRFHSQCPDETRLHADYWCATGLFFLDQSEYETATGLLLKAVTIDPTMRIAFQRLSRCFAALGRSDDAAQFRFRGTQLAQSETMGDRIVEDSRNLAVRNDLAKMLLELGRPLEALEWTRTVIPNSAMQQHAALAARRREVAAMPDVDTIASTVALLEVNPSQFPFDAALKKLREDTRAASSLDSVAAIRPPSSAPRLVNVAEERNADFQWYHDEEINFDSIPLYESVGGGIAVLDYDLDGWPDLYFCQGSGRPPEFKCTRSNQLRRNLGVTYSDVSALAEAEDFNYSSGVAAGDVNQDGFTDLYLGALGRNRLLINNGDGTFREVTDQLGSDQNMFTSSLAIADIDGDHLPDLFEVNYIETEGAYAQPRTNESGEIELPSPLLFLPQADRWFQSTGDGVFVEHLVSSGLAEPATGLGIIVANLDGIGGNEVFVGNDMRPNHLLRFTDGGLVNLADAKGVANGFEGLANGCMGIATGDFDRNGTLDLRVANYREEADNLYLQRADGLFRDAAPSYALRPLTFPNVGFGIKTLDIDRNGWLDFVVTNGHIFDMSHINKGYKMPPQAMMGRGDRFVLAEVEDPTGYWSGHYLGRTMAMTDFNRDGATDFVIGHLDAPTALLENQTETTGQNVMLELIGTVSERDAVGAKVVLHSDGERVVQWVTAGDGYFCTDDPYLDLALADMKTIDKVEVAWSSGRKTEYRGLSPGNRYLLIENESEPFLRQRP